MNKTNTGNVISRISIKMDRRNMYYRLFMYHLLSIDSKLFDFLSIWIKHKLNIYTFYKDVKTWIIDENLNISNDLG